MVSPATKKADLGGIDTPPSANCLVVHNPAKCSVFSRSTQGHGEISFPFGNHPPPHPLFSLRSQTATSQLAGFRNWEISNLSDSKLGKTIPIQHLHICWQLNSIRDEWWNYSTSKLQTCHCHRMSGTWHLQSNRRSIQWSPPHTRPWRPRRQSGCLWNWFLWRTRLSSAPRLRPGGSDRLRLASRSWFLPSKPDHWNPTNNSHSTERYRISLIQNLEKQSPFSIYIFADNSTPSEKNDETTAPPNHPNFSLSKDVENMTSWHAAAFSGAHRTPGLGTLVANVAVSQIDVRDGLVDFKCLGQGLEAATDQGCRLDFRALQTKPDFWNAQSKWHSMEKFFRHPQFIQIIQQYSASAYLLTTQLDQRWMMKLQHLQHGQTCHCQRMSKIWQHDMPQHSAILRSPSHTPGLGALGTNVFEKQTDARDGRVCLQRLGQGLDQDFQSKGSVTWNLAIAF